MEWTEVHQLITEIEASVIQGDAFGVQQQLPRLVDVATRMRQCQLQPSEEEKQLLNDTAQAFRRVEQLMKQRLDLVRVWMEAWLGTQRQSGWYA